MKNFVLMTLFLFCCTPLCASETPELEKPYNITQKERIDRSKRTARKRVNQIRIDLKLSLNKEVGQFFVDKLQLSSEQIRTLIRITEASRMTSDSYKRTALKVQSVLTQEQMVIISQLIREYPFLTSSETFCTHDASSTNVL